MEGKAIEVLLAGAAGYARREMVTGYNYKPRSKRSISAASSLFFEFGL